MGGKGQLGRLALYFAAYRSVEEACVSWACPEKSDTGLGGEEKS
jgi:hypothetical protein